MTTQKDRIEAAIRHIQTSVDIDPWVMELAVEALKAQDALDTNVGNNGDTIYRQAAIDIVDFECGEWRGLAKTIEQAIERLPSAQPEIIRCKDCKYMTRWRSKESARKFGQIYECRRGVFSVPKPDDFCSKAERRTDERTD